MDEATLDRLAGRREIETITGLRPTRLNEIIKDEAQKFPQPVKVLANGERLWDAEEVRQWLASRSV